MPEPKTTHARVSVEAKAVLASIARQRGAKEIDVTNAAVMSLDDYLAGVSPVQIPELVATLSDLRDGVAMLIAQVDELDRLGTELAAIELERTK